MASLTQSTWFEQTPGDSVQEIAKDREAWRAAVYRVAKSWT